MQPSTITTGNLLIGYVQTVHAWAAQDEKDVRTYSSTILDKGRDVESHIIHSYP